MIAEEATQSDRALRNTASLLASRVAIAAMGWAGTVVMARILSPDDWGKFSFVFGLLGMMSIITDLGVGRVVLARLVDSDHDEVSRVASTFIALRAVLGVFGYLFAVGFVVISGYPSDVVIATAIAGLVVVIATPSHALTVLFQSRLRLSYVAAGEAFAQVVQLALTILAALMAPLLLVFVLPAIANELVSVAVKIRGVRRGMAGPLPARRAEVWRWREMLLEAVPLSIGYAFIEVTSRIDVLMLGKMDTFASVGLYSIGFKFSDFVKLAALAVITPFMTLLVAAWPNDPSAFRAAARRSASLIGVLCAVGIAGFWPIARPLLEILYGERFAEAALATRLLVAGAVLGALTQLALMALVAAGRHKVYPWVALACLLLNVALNFWLIPAYSYTGAAWAAFAAQVVMLVVICVVVTLTLPVKGLMPVGQILGVYTIALAVILTAEEVTVLRDLPWWVLGPACAIIVLALSHALRLTGGFSIRGWIADRRRANDD
ncbi:hypothetical protein GCM10009624_01250 [Gordonia sinesedis]